MIKLYGNSLSPYVRKVMIVLAYKGIAYANDPLSPVMNPSAEFLAISPLRKIPVLVEGDLVLPDSSVICRYLEDAHPLPPLYPRDIRARARACWLEEYADTKLTECVAPLAGERIFKPRLMKQPVDEANVARILDELLPEPLAYLESVAPEAGFACGDFSIADVAIGAAFINGLYAGFAVDPTTHRRLHAQLARTLATPVFAAQLANDRRDYSRLFA